jgi:multidrug efflux system membrane fusion protein
MSPRKAMEMDQAARESQRDLERKGPAPAARSGPKRLVLLVVVGAVVALGVVFFTRKHGAPGAAGAGPAPAGSAGVESRPVPVVIAETAQRDVPIYLEGLGNAVPLATVVVKTQVDGRLDKVLFTEGQSVKKGEVLAQIDPRPYVIALHQAEAAMARDAAQSRNAKRNLERYQNLVAQKLIAQQQVDDQQTMFDQAEAAIASDRTLAENARLQLDYAKIKSPIDGVTGVRLVDPGNIVHPADATGIVVVTQLDPMAVVFTLPEDDLPRISRELAKGPLTVEAYNRDGATKLALGKLSFVDNQVNQQTATVKLKAVFPNPDKALWPNGFIKARLHLTTRQGALTVPASAIQRGPNGTFVYVVDAANKTSVRPVVVDVVEDDLAILQKGLAPGERVVTEGQNQLRPGAIVAPRAPGAGGAEKPRGTGKPPNAEAASATAAPPPGAPSGARR